MHLFRPKQVFFGLLSNPFPPFLSLFPWSNTTLFLPYLPMKLFLGFKLFSSSVLLPDHRLHFSHLLRKYLFSYWVRPFSTIVGMFFPCRFINHPINRFSDSIVILNIIVIVLITMFYIIPFPPTLDFIFCALIITHLGEKSFFSWWMKKNVYLCSRFRKYEIWSHSSVG